MKSGTFLATRRRSELITGGRRRRGGATTVGLTRGLRRRRGDATTVGLTCGRRRRGRPGIPNSGRRPDARVGLPPSLWVLHGSVP
jgi:hypothetical protein